MTPSSSNPTLITQATTGLGAVGQIFSGGSQAGAGVSAAMGVGVQATSDTLSLQPAQTFVGPGLGAQALAQMSTGLG